MIMICYEVGLPVIYTVKPASDDDDLAAYEGKAPYVSHDGIVINSSTDSTQAKGDALSLNGLSVEEAIEKVNEWLESAGVGEGSVSYRLRDWLFSRQRYWGEPFPIVYDEDGVAHLLPDSMLPIICRTCRTIARRPLILKMPKATPRHH